MSGANILFIFVDQLRADTLGCAGHPLVRTPHIDALAAEGTRFTQAFTTSPICVPARYSLLAERYPHQTRIRNNCSHLWPEAPSFVRQLRDAGLHTANWGKLHYGWRADLDLGLADPILHGHGFDEPHEIAGKCSQGKVKFDVYRQHLQESGLYEEWIGDLQARADRTEAHGGVCTTPFGHGPSVLPEEDHIDTWVLNQADAWLRARDDEKPFFLWVGPPGPHDPYDPSAPYDTLYDPALTPPALTGPPPGETNPTEAAAEHLTSEDIATARAAYYGNLTQIDDGIGRLVETLRAQGRLADTWIIASSDHGDHLGDYGLSQKSTFYDSSVRIPLIIRPPDSVDAPRGQVCEDLVSLIDLSATMTAIAGAEPVPGGQGRSLLPQVLGQEGNARPAVLSEVFDMQMLATPEWKWVRRPATGETLRLTNRATDPEERDNLRDCADIVERLDREFLQPLLAEAPTDLPEPWEKQFPQNAWPENPVTAWQRSLPSYHRAMRAHVPAEAAAP